MKNLVGLNDLSEYDGVGTAFGDTGKNQGRVVAIEEGRIACVRRPVNPCTLAFGSNGEVVFT